MFHLYVKFFWKKYVKEKMLSIIPLGDWNLRPCTRPFYAHYRIFFDVPLGERWVLLSCPWTYNNRELFERMQCLHKFEGGLNQDGHGCIEGLCDLIVDKVRDVVANHA